METNSKQEYINVLIDNFNKYDYYTNDQSTIFSLQNLKNVKTNADLSSCLKDLHNKNLAYQILHQESYIHPGTKDSYLDLNENLATLLIYLENNPKQEISKLINPVIKEPISNLSYLMIVEQTLDVTSIHKSIQLTESTMKNISVDTLYYPLMFNKNKKMFDVPDYYGKFSNKEWMIEIPQVDNKFKSSTLTHETFHALDAYIYFQLKKEYPELQTTLKEFTSFIQEIKMYEDCPEVFDVDLENIKNNKNYKSFFEFCNNFDKIPQSKKLSQEDTKEYIKQYLNIDISKYKDETEFTQQILDVYSNERDKLPKHLLDNSSNNTDKIKQLSNEIFNYYHNDYSDKSMYSLMSDMISKLASEDSGYRCNLNEKCARVFEMNSYSNKNEDIYKLLPENISDKNIYPIGNEREYYVSILNNELKNMSKLLNEHIILNEPLPTPRKKYTKENIPEGFTLPKQDDNKFDLSRLSKSNALSNMQKIRELQNKSSTCSNKLKIY